MNFLPIVDRELRVASRQRWTYWNRSVAVLGAMAILGYVLLISMQLSGQRSGQMVFWTIGTFFYAGSLLSGLMYTADCLSAEKREGTLGLLFLTRLRGADVILGKLASSSLSAVYGLMAIVPLMTVPLILGGVTSGEVGRFVLALFGALLSSLAAGVLGSALAREARQAMSWTVLLLILVHGVGPLAGFVTGIRNEQQPSVWFFVPSGGFAGISSHPSFYGRMAGLYWLSVGYSFVAAGLMLAAASRVVRRSWQERATGGRVVRLREGWRRLLYGGAETRMQLRRVMLDVNPAYWLTGRHRYRRVLVWLALGLAGAGWAYAYWTFKDGWANSGGYVVTAICLHLILMLWVASDSVQLLGPDARSGALELVFGTRTTVREWLRGHRMALLRQFAGPVVVVLLADFLMMLFGLEEFGSDGDYWIAVWLCGMGLLVFNMVTLAQFGMWQGVTQKRLNRASGNAVTLVVAAPWLLLVMVLILLSVARIPMPGLMGPYWVLGFYVVLQSGINLLVMGWANRLLQGALRGRAFRRGEPG
ncbi:MAG: hypothetical protein RI897_344 [Verrucomicrobiota bacterium]|jgi:ABC-type transport system involved in multi-copper enzyme maturation permease subunit